MDKTCPTCVHDEHGSERCMPLSYMTGKPVPGDPVCACTGPTVTKRDALAESHAELVEALLHAATYDIDQMAARRRALAVVAKARALVPEAK